MNILETRVDNRFDGNGITGSHFPSFEFGLALIYHVFGEHWWVQRTYCLFWHLLGIIGMYFLTFHLFRSKVLAGLASWAFTWSPLLFYYGISALPDDLALPASIWGLYSALVWLDKKARQESGQFFPMFLAFLLISLGGLTKIQYLSLGFFLLAYVFQMKEHFKKEDWLVFSLFGFGISSITISWYLFAVARIEKSGLNDFGILFNPETDFAEALQIISSNLISDLPESILNFSTFVFFLFSLFILFKKKRINKLIGIPILVWSGILVIYHLIELGQMKHHDYYMMPYLPVLCILSAHGAYWMLESRLVSFAFFLLFLQPILAGIRIIPARFLSEEKGAGSILQNMESLSRLKKAVPDSSLCVVGPDNSRCIFFYFLHKKGFGFGDQIITGNELKEYRKKGARYLYSSSRDWINKPDISNLLGQKLAQEGDIQVYSLK